MNLIFTSQHGVSDAEMKKRILALAKDQDNKYVLVVDKLQFGSEDFDPSMMSEGSLPKPAIMRRVYSDGHEQLVRGGTFGAVPMRSLKDLLVMGATPVVYNYTGSGMASRYAALMSENGGGYFVSIAAPTIVFRDLDVKKPLGPQRNAPIVPRPQPTK